MTRELEDRNTTITDLKEHIQSMKE